MAFTPAQLREYRRGLKARGVCVVCHRVPARENRTSCDRCAEKRTQRLRAHKLVWKRDPKVCDDCGRPSRPGYTYCAPCADSRNLGIRRRRRKRRAAGLCTLCGDKLPEYGPDLRGNAYRRCFHCTQQSNAAHFWRVTWAG